MSPPPEDPPQPPRSKTPPGYTSGPDLEKRMERLLSAGGVREEIGRSRDGRPIFAHRWDARGGSLRRGGILLISLLHPMEWIGLEAHLALLEGWLLPPGGGAEPAEAGGVELPQHTPLYSIPIANPDGYERVERSLASGRPRWIRGNLARIDLNRNFPVGHRPTPHLFPWWPLYRGGPLPLSEPETAAIAGWARTLDLERLTRSYRPSGSIRRALVLSAK